LRAIGGAITEPSAIAHVAIRGSSGNRDGTTEGRQVRVLTASGKSTEGACLIAICAFGALEQSTAATARIRRLLGVAAFAKVVSTRDFGDALSRTWIAEKPRVAVSAIVTLRHACRHVDPAAVLDASRVAIAVRI